MKARDIRMCDGCGGTLLCPGIGTFYKVSVSICLPNPRAIRERVAMDVLFPGAPAVAAAFVSDDEVAIVAGDKEPALWTHLLLCFECYSSDRNLASIVEMYDRKREGEALGEEPGGGS